MKQGALLTISSQEKYGLFWAQQDQVYEPRALNVLKAENSDYEWQLVSLSDMNKDTILAYQAVAFTPITLKYKKEILQWYPTVEVILISTDQFMRFLAPKAAVIGQTTGYLIVAGSDINQNKLPKELSPQFKEENLRQLMREYPSVYWLVKTLEETRELLHHNTKHVTVALAPKAWGYETQLQEEFPEIKILRITPKNLMAIPKEYEKVMLVVAIVTMILLALMGIFQ